MKVTQETRDVRILRRALHKLQEEINRVAKKAESTSEALQADKRILEYRLEASSNTLRASLSNFSRSFYKTRKQNKKLKKIVQILKWKRYCDLTKNQQKIISDTCDLSSFGK
tara:strand:+ start:10009 stop:10344 length:336 start_codon:yes stop_codon:yes gene_type:complete